MRTLQELEARIKAEVETVIQKALSSQNDFLNLDAAFMAKECCFEVVLGLSDILADLWLIQPMLEVAIPENNLRFDSLSRRLIQKCLFEDTKPLVLIRILKQLKQAYLQLLHTNRGMQNRDELILIINSFFDKLEWVVYSKTLNGQPDVSAQKLKTKLKQLQREKNLYQTVFERDPSPILIVDKDQRLLNFNLEASVAFRNLSFAQPIYQEVNESLAGLRQLSIVLDEFIKGNTTEARDKVHLQTYLDDRDYEAQLKKMFDYRDELQGVIVLLNDLTERQKVETSLEEAKKKAEEADRLKTTFLANMSHEIRTPMNAIVGFAELLINSQPKQDEQKEYLEQIHKSSKDLLRIIEDIIDISKLESKQLKIKRRPVKPYEIFQDLYQVYQTTLLESRSNDVDLLLEVAEADREILLLTDPDRLKQVMINLLNNAAKFTSRGSIEFGYKLVDKGMMFFYVKDTGEGIPEDMKDKIFERFVQANDNYSPKFGGTGLGLAISKNIISLMGGKIWLSSELGVGSNFSFQLPLLKPAVKDLPKNEPVQQTQKRRYPNFTGKKILVAEDEETNFFFLKEMLKKTKVKIAWAQNGLDAINYAESEEDIDLILMDIKMPQVNGIEATKYISGIKPELPIVAQTAFAMENDIKTCKEAGCCGFLSKPIKSEELYGLLTDILVKDKVKVR